MRGLLIACAVATMTIAAAAEAAGPAARDTACVFFSGDPAGAGISLERGHTLSGVLPVTLCSVAPETSYRLRLDGPGLERRSGVFSLSSAGRPTVRGIRLSTIARNAVVPGWGSVRADRAAGGGVDLLSIAATGIVFWQEQAEYDNLHHRFEALTAGAEAAATYAERGRFQEALHEASRAVNVQNDHRKRIVLLGGALYGFQVVESFIVDRPPTWRPGPASGSVTVSGARASRARALVLSVLRPGRGQLYQGKRVRGVLLSATSVAAGLVALEYWNRYDRAADSYELSVERYEAATGIAERISLAAESDLLWSEVEDRERERNVSFGVLAGIWGLGVVDVFFGSAREEAGAPLAVELDARGPSIVFRF